MLGTRRTIGIVSGLVLAAGLYLTATPTQSVPSIMQAQQLEVVNADGTIVFSIRAAEAGGRLEVRDGAGATIFSAGVDPDDPKRFGLWEQSQRTIASQRRDLERQRRDLNHLITRLQEFERQNLKLGRNTRRGHEIDQYRSALARQDREIDNLERQVNRLSRQLNSLERRQ
ncbi:hypothetical protein [Candidatus Entotheonella palauensis]|nr:hypothetical protein [Candidatus Entotheonella palauensis]